MLQNEIKFTELSTSFLVGVGTGRTAASQAATAGPHSLCLLQASTAVIQFLFITNSLKGKQNNKKTHLFSTKD